MDFSRTAWMPCQVGQLLEDRDLRPDTKQAFEARLHDYTQLPSVFVAMELFPDGA